MQRLSSGRTSSWFPVSPAAAAVMGLSDVKRLERDTGSQGDYQATEAMEPKEGALPEGDIDLPEDSTGF